ncbi:Endonuclease/exonuclease/phosphatase [Cladochytrium replicatum]|nr:Endonuclease/exonuclease/phosphatase [Cladochytrium replicatum]
MALHLGRSMLAAQQVHDGFSFSLMSYNILAQCLVKRELYPYADKQSLRMKHRYQNLIDEIRALSPDIACFQEVDNFEQMEVFLTQSGYEYRYLKKDESKTTGHGICIVWKKERFAIHQYETIHYDDSPLIQADTIPSDTRNIAQILALRPLTPTPAFPGFVLTNTHLYWRPAAHYDRLRQVYILMTEAFRFRSTLTPAGEKPWPIFLTGDFNSDPSGAIYRILTRQGPLTPKQLEKLRPVLQHQPSEADDAATTPIAPPEPPTVSDESLVTDLVSEFDPFPRFASAYSTYAILDPNHRPEWDPSSTEPQFTVFGKWKGTLDYLYFCDDAGGDSSGGLSSGRLNVESVLSIPSAQELEPGIPNRQYPSDHVAVMARFVVQNDDGEN